MTLSRKLPLCKTLDVNDICMFLSSDLHVFKRFFALSGCEDGSEGLKSLWNVCLTPLIIIKMVILNTHVLVALLLNLSPDSVVGGILEIFVKY